MKIVIHIHNGNPKCITPVRIGRTKTPTLNPLNTGKKLTSQALESHLLNETEYNEELVGFIGTMEEKD